MECRDLGFVFPPVSVVIVWGSRICFFGPPLFADPRSSAGRRQAFRKRPVASQVSFRKFK